MKILKLRFKNLNSLENENTINFEEAPFSETGVFAITGPNGSGKSTILDAITLGLFGETFRFDRPADHVMTRHASECYSEIEFSLGNHKFRSSWYVQRTSGDPAGELMPSEMKLTRLNGNEEVLATTPAQVCAKISEITGMNFRSFTRSILLAQGDFAAFLNALDSERLDILETIISTDIYADRQKDILDNADHAQQKLDFLKKEMAALSLLDPIKREAFEHDLTDYQEQYKELQSEEGILKQQQTQLAGIEALQTQITRQENNLKALESEAEAEQKKLAKVISGQSVLDFKDDREAIIAAELAVQDSNTTLATFKTELKQLESRLALVSTDPNTLAGLANLSFSEQQQTIASTRTQVNVLNSNRHAALQLSQSLETQIKDKGAVLAAVSSWLEEHAVDHHLVEHFPDIRRLKTLRDELAELTQKQNSFSQWSTKATLTQKKTSAAFDKQEKSLLDRKQKMAEDEAAVAELLQSNTIEAIEELQAEQKERVNSIQELIKLSEAHQKLSGPRGFFGLFKSKEQPDLDADALIFELDELRQQIKREENIKRALDELVFGEALRKKMATDRYHLVDGKPCPLCGSLQHPYAKNPPAMTNSQQALIDQQAKVKALKIQAEAIERSITVAKKQAETSQAKQLRLQHIRSQWLTLCNRLNVVSPDLDINNQKLMKALLKNEIVELTEITSLISKYRIKQKNIGKLTAQIAKLSTSIELLQANGQQLDNEWQSKSQVQIDNEAALATCQQEDKELSETLSEQLTVLGEAIPDRGIEDALYERLTARLQDYQTHVFRNKSLIEDVAALKQKLTNCEVEIKDCDEKLKIFSSQLESDETIGLHLALIEKQKLIADKEQILVIQMNEVARLLQLFQGRLQDSEFSSLGQIDEILALLQTLPALQQRKAELDQQLAHKAQELERSKLQLVAERETCETESSMAEITAQWRSVTGKMDIAHQEARRLDNILKEQERLQQKFDALASQLEDQEKLTQHCLEEKALLEHDNGRVFRRRVQSQMADKLLSQTNAILEKISGRYYLRQAPSELGLALEIEDTYQANARRLPKTLSGGESFIVSLALALGLSELANNGKSVDSLFLDEGFGNLDAETLYTVISTLERLHTHGKTVGVISHVEAVQKRIKAQLQVVKKPNGMGMLKKAS
ncbi:MAG: AAA family ATPase [Methylococcaceae bacterium]|nr:AAA family ATPase [Methylococcaceae bacterium]